MSPKTPSLSLLLFLSCLVAVEVPGQPAPDQQSSPDLSSDALRQTDLEPTVVEYPEEEDTLRPFNKAIFAFNHVTRRFAITPLSKGYRRIVPEPARKSIGNVFDTAQAPLSALHHGLQGNGRKSLSSLKRFGINLTLGVAGVFDPATQRFGIQKTDTDFDATLRQYGMGRGPYLVIPFIGASDCRDTLGLIGDSLLHPFSIFDRPLSTQLKVTDAFQENAPFAENYMELYRETEDPYRFFRNFYEQGQRRDEDYPTEPEQN
ncbi:VacJ family lipoprotein [Pelagicoccus sp. SDUM812002]|uniref:MlaA family lipoprotein n=1 Tax=Pelagicoccus sp. SDUM812002 TaxID=3041266 RepID=UPI0028103A38|nr:VacJ family lipoprotein [Pelagicoccus sp. SDUM812002]MDQ8187735.1 VacJ family lipoprotein [Pelagicoccus sp. SDUM812002]